MDKSVTRRKYIKFFTAAVFSALASCIYSFGDTIIIGQYEGDLGIRALNLIIPIYTILYALGLLFGMGTGIMISYLRSKNKNADAYFSVSFFTLVTIVGIFIVFSEIFFKEFMTLFGGDENTMPYLMAYGKYITRGAWIFSVMPFLNCVVRNDNRPVLVTVGVVLSCSLNILLDFVFVFLLKMGMEGAGLATMLCTGGQMLLSATHLLSRRCTIGLTFKGLAIGKLFKAIKGGFASFVSEISSGVFMIFMNRQLNALIPAAGVEIYLVAGGLALITNSILNGAAVASQPIISDAFGAKKYDEVDYCKRLGLITVAVLSVIIYAAVAIYPVMYAYVFSSNPSEQFLLGVPTAVRLYMTSTFFYGFNLFFISCYQATLKGTFAAILNFLRGMVFNSILVFVLPLIAPVAIWLVVPLSEALTLAIICVFMLKHKKNAKQTPKIA